MSAEFTAPIPRDGWEIQVNPVMCIHILSDLHFELAPFQPNKADADVVVLAGDVHTGSHFTCAWR